MTTIYLAAPLFNLAERVHNTRLAILLRDMGYDVFVPQEHAVVNPDGSLDLHATCLEDLSEATSRDFVVANIDGPDADSGTSVEIGAALAKAGRTQVICVRTDFRTSQTDEVGINGMLQLASSLIYMPCASVTEPYDAEDFYHNLVGRIHDEIQRLLKQRGE